MSDLLTLQAVRDRLQAACDLAGGQRRFAEVNGIRDSIISETLHAKRHPGPAILAALGLSEVRRFAVTRKSNHA
jgi:hypothetical protein